MIALRSLPARSSWPPKARMSSKSQRETSPANIETWCAPVLGQMKSVVARAALLPAVDKGVRTKPLDVSCPKKAISRHDEERHTSARCEVAVIDIGASDSSGILS